MSMLYFRYRYYRYGNEVGHCEAPNYDTITRINKFAPKQFNPSYVGDKDMSIKYLFDKKPSIYKVHKEEDDNTWKQLDDE